LESRKGGDEFSELGQKEKKKTRNERHGASRVVGNNFNDERRRENALRVKVRYRSGEHF